MLISVSIWLYKRNKTTKKVLCFLLKRSNVYQDYFHGPIHFIQQFPTWIFMELFDVKIILIFSRLFGVVSILLATQRIKSSYIHVIQSVAQSLKSQAIQLKRLILGIKPKRVIIQMKSSVEQGLCVLLFVRWYFNKNIWVLGFQFCIFRNERVNVWPPLHYSSFLRPFWCQLA